MRVVSPSGAAAGSGSRRENAGGAKFHAARKHLNTALGKGTAELLGPAVLEGMMAGIPSHELSRAFRDKRIATAKKVKGEVKELRRAEAATRPIPSMSTAPLCVPGERKLYGFPGARIDAYNDLYAGAELDPRM